MSSAPSTPSSPTSPPAEPYEIKAVTSQDGVRVLEFLKTFFFRDEPLNVNLRLIEHPEYRCKELEEYSIKCLKDNLSLMAVTNSGKIIGVSRKSSLKCLLVVLVLESLREVNL